MAVGEFCAFHSILVSILLKTSLLVLRSRVGQAKPYVLRLSLLPYSKPCFAPARLPNLTSLRTLPKFTACLFHLQLNFSSLLHFQPHANLTSQVSQRWLQSQRQWARFFATQSTRTSKSGAMVADFRSIGPSSSLCLKFWPKNVRTSLW